jgi:hypothetical protein
MYNTGAGYSEKRQIMNQSLSYRVYDSMKGIKINIIQVNIPDFALLQHALHDR